MRHILQILLSLTVHTDVCRDGFCYFASENDNSFYLFDVNPTKALNVWLVFVLSTDISERFYFLSSPQVLKVKKGEMDFLGNTVNEANCCHLE